MAVQEPGRSKGFPCKQCSLVCPNMPSLIEHMDSHLQEEEDRKYKCDECGRGYRHAGSLANHKKTHEVGSFQCQICGKENSNALALKSHLRSHTSQKKYGCMDCGKAFRLASQLATHERVHLTKHVKEQSFRTVDDEYDESENRDELQEDDQHLLYEQSAASGGVSMENSAAEDEMGPLDNSEMSEDLGNRPFKCDLCNKSYIHYRSLTNHKKTHQTGMFECTVCFKQFNNMAALYSHQRTHRSRSGAEPAARDGAYPSTPLSQFSPQNRDTSVNFCHLCQVLFSTDEEFQEHIQMHNSSSGSYGDMQENHNVSYEDSIHSPQSNLYASPVNNNPSSSSSADNHGDYDPSEQIMNNGQMFADCSSSQTPAATVPQGEPAMDDNEDAAEMEDGSDSGERRFKCEACGKRYRHSGSLINHRRSHQVGIYQCSICRKSYPHLAALKSHLRLHKAQPSSFSLNSEGDWLSSEPLTLGSPHGSFLTQEEEGSDTDAMLAPDQEAAGDTSSYHNPYQLPQDEHPMQRHQCADCGETFADIAGIKSHTCPLHHQRQEAGYSGDMDFGGINGDHSAINPEDGMDFPGVNGNDHDQSYFSEEGFPEHDHSEQLNGDGDGGEEADEEDEDDDGDLYQCSVCGNRYTSMRALRSHLRGHTQSHGTPASSGPSSMSSHEEMKDEESGEMMMICSTCGESFTKRQDLIAHQLSHNATKAEADADRPHTLNNHHDDNSSTQSNEEPQSIICGCCGLFCASYNHLKNHGCGGGGKEKPSDVKEEMSGNKPVSSREERVPRRIKGIADGGDRQYKCEQCGRSYRHAGSLLNHKKSHKTGVFRCLVCQKRFYNLLALKNHQRSHFDVKRHACHECGKAFKIQKQLLNHLRRHKENQAKIQELNTQIQALMQLNGPDTAGPQPLRRNTRRPPGSIRRRRPASQNQLTQARPDRAIKSENTGDLRPFSCDQCGRTYRHAGSLVNHKNSHKTGEYCCSVCNNTYPNQLAMKNHLRTHFAYKKHSCQNCGKGFRGKKMLQTHICGRLRKEGAKSRRPLKVRTYRCKECKCTFPSTQHLAGHTCDRPSDEGEVRAGGPEERPFTCTVCNRSYRHAGSLLNHKNTHKTGHFSCGVCAKPFTNPMALRNHTRIHTQKKKYACLTCGKAFRLASILHNHQKIHSRGAGHFSCPECGKSFQGRSGLKRHRCQRSQENTPRAAVHHADSGDKCFMCDLCGRSYRHAGSLLNHKKTHSENLHHCTMCLQTFPDPVTLQIHSQMKRHCCPECGKTFCLISHLQSHMDVHSKDRMSVCSPRQQTLSSPRQQTLSSPSGYASHRPQGHYHHHHQQQQSPDGATNGSRYWNPGMDQSLDGMPKLIPPLSHMDADPEEEEEEGGVGEKSHVCDHCGRTYRHAGSLLNHKNSHKTGSFFCSVCQKEFTNLMALKNHRRIHTEPKRYQCLECGKAFRVSTQLICHRRIHTKEKPFACLLCDKSFSSKSNLRHHQKMHQNAQAYESFSMDANSFMDLDMGSFL
ncbi:hypothetical protein NHX12_025062 [Muraenolepis orangiensis]|uniref:C2H2-type domain-containing protein n=1 Tax=Muraenolepis orangiensis TaxID=630683 RepID=A0A9Q0EP79_9TELE|nr:hypothetical protein NHX12_025062 [Muraenolepis orangiensis]